MKIVQFIYLMAILMVTSCASLANEGHHEPAQSAELLVHGRTVREYFAADLIGMLFDVDAIESSFVRPPELRPSFADEEADYRETWKDGAETYTITTINPLISQSPNVCIMFGADETLGRISDLVFRRHNIEIEVLSLDDFGDRFVGRGNEGRSALVVEVSPTTYGVKKVWWRESDEKFWATAVDREICDVVCYPVCNFSGEELYGERTPEFPWAVRFKYSTYVTR